MNFRTRHLSALARLGMVGACLLASSAVIIAGPPLVVDDAETLDRGQVELFTSFLFATEGSMRSYATPTELTIGLAKGWECSINGAYLYETFSSSTPNTVSGVPSLEVGTKYRVLTESTDVPISLALSGKLRFPTSASAKYAEQGKPIGSGFLIVGRTFGAYLVNANVGYGVGGSQAREMVGDAWFFGVTAQRIFAKKYTVFAEVYSLPPVGRFRDAVVNADSGVLWDLSDRYRFTVLLGRGFRPGGADFLCNVGFLLSLGPKPSASNPGK